MSISFINNRAIVYWLQFHDIAQLNMNQNSSGLSSGYSQTQITQN